MPSLGTPVADTVGMQFPWQYPSGIHFPAYLKTLFREKLFLSIQTLNYVPENPGKRVENRVHAPRKKKKKEANKGMGENKDILPPHMNRWTRMVF